MKLLNDEEIVDALSSADDVRRQEALYVLFKSTDLRNKIFRYVFDQVADAETAREIFQFALVTFEQKVRTGAFEKRSGVHTYILGIVKWHLLNERRKSSRITEFNPLAHAGDAFVVQIDDDFSDETRHEALYQIIEQLGERCRKLLPRWAKNASPEEIAREFGFSSPEMAKKETYRCRQKMIAFVEKNPHLKSLLKP
ncbi:MAG: RNA polymerase sigma factor [Saprospiraceae bacterium]